MICKFLNGFCFNHFKDNNKIKIKIECPAVSSSRVMGTSVSGLPITCINPGARGVPMGRASPWPPGLETWTDGSTSHRSAQEANLDFPGIRTGERRASAQRDD